MDNINVAALLPADFSDQSKAWVFQSSRFFIDKEQLEINEQLSQFAEQWKSHGAPVRGWAKLLFGQFIVVLADELQTDVGGCSTDSMVRIIKSIERQYSVNMFDRLMLTFLVKGKAEMLPLGQVRYALERNMIDEDTYLFNNAVTSKQALLKEWLVPLKESWLANKVL